MYFLLQECILVLHATKHTDIEDFKFFLRTDSKGNSPNLSASRAISKETYMGD